MAIPVKSVRKATKLEPVILGYPRLDKAIKGLQPGEVYLFASHPGVGKSAFVLNVLDRLAMQQKTPTGILSLDLNKNQFLVRLAAISGKLDLFQLYLGKGSEKSQEMFAQKLGEISRSPIQSHAVPRLNLTEFAQEALRMKERSAVRLLIVDSIQQVHLDESTTQVATIRDRLKVLKGLQKLAKELKIPILVTALVTGELEKPKTKAAAEWKEFTKAFAWSMILEAHDAFEEQKGKMISSIQGKVELVRKGRLVGSVKLEFIPRFSRFE